MTNFTWSKLTSGQSINFDANNDQINFDIATISAASVIVTFSIGATNLSFGSKSITLLSDITTFKNTNFVFADGSRLILANNGDSAVGANGNDQLIGFGNYDNYFQSSAGNNIYNGGPNGQYGDAVDYLAAPNGVNVNLLTGIGQNGYGGADQLINIEHINGSAFDDILIGNSYTNWFMPGNGNDSVNGGFGTDVVMYEEASAGVNINLGADIDKVSVFTF